ncbi:PE family protein, partial [Mycobacterium szulgai]
MSFVMAAPEQLAAAATDIASVGAAVRAANTAAFAPTTALVAAGADEVSTALASLFAGYAQEYRALSSQVEAFHQRFIQLLSTSAGSYAWAEAASANPLQALLTAVNAPTEALLGRPLIGDGAAGGAVDGVGQAGRAGGLLYGNGGAGGASTAAGQAGGA